MTVPAVDERITWPQWLEVLDYIAQTWPRARESFLALDYAGELAEVTTLRAWHKLLHDAGYTDAQVYAAVMRYAATDKQNAWPPEGPVIARYARDIAIEDRAEAARRAQPAPEPNPVGAQSFAQRHGFANITEYRKSRCASQNHYGLGTDATCRGCNDLPPMSVVMEHTAYGNATT